MSGTFFQSTKMASALDTPSCNFSEPGFCILTKGGIRQPVLYQPYPNSIQVLRIVSPLPRQIHGGLAHEEPPPRHAGGRGQNDEDGGGAGQLQQPRRGRENTTGQEDILLVGFNFWGSLFLTTLKF